MSRAISRDAVPTAAASQSLLPINRWFVWKEVRQLLPLIVALLLAAAAMLFIQSEMFTSWKRVVPLAILVFPGLFAVGAGTVLVGQEREQRTMDWLTTLPIPSRNLILIKFAVALAGLALMWLIALVTLTATGIGHDYASQWLTFRGGRIAANSLTPVSYPLWLAHSVYVMLCSFFASWRIRNQFVALIVIAPLACIPLFLCEFVLEGFYSSTGQQLKMAATVWVRLIGTLVSVPVMGLLTYRMAMRVLAPQSAPKYRFVSPLQSLTGTSRETQSAISQAPTFGSQITSIIWQSIHSAPLLWFALFSMMVLGIYLPITRIRFDGILSQWFLFDAITFLSPLIVSWLGVSVFKNDGSAARLQFLSDRGIAPTKIYLGRHAVPIAIVASGLIVYTILATYQSTHQMIDNRRGGLPSMAAVALLFAVFYSVSQWTSQVIRMLIVAAIIAPILSILVLSWWSIAGFDMSAPPWMLAIIAALPMLATWWMMPRYMDMRDRPRNILLGFAIAFMMVALPVVPQVWQLIKIARSGEIPTYATLLPLREEGQAAIEAAPNAVRLLVRYYKIPNMTRLALGNSPILPDQAIELWNARARTPDEFLVGLSELRIRPECAATIPDVEWKALRDLLMLERLKFEVSSASENSGAIDAFSAWVDAASLIAQSLRRNPKWYDQEVADRLEAWLVDTLNSPEMALHRDAEFFAAAVTRLPDAQQRKKSRRAGILATGANWKYPTAEERLSLNRDPLVDRLAEKMYVLPTGVTALDLNSIVVVAIETLDSNGASVNGIPWQQRMHAAVFRNSMPFELGPYAPRFRDLPTVATLDGKILYPARYWNLPWEDEAAALKLAYSTTDSTNQSEGDDQ